MASFVIPLISGLAGLFGGKPKQQETTSTTNSSQNSDYNNLTQAFLTGGQSHLMDSFINDALNKYNHELPDIKGYEAGGLEQINQGADLKQKIIANTLAQKGLSFSPAAAYPQVLNESDRVNQGTQFLDQIPQLQRQFQQQNFQNLMSAFGATPIAQQSSGSSEQQGTSTTKGNQTQPGNSTGGLFSGIGSGLNLPSSPGGGQSNLGGIMQTLGLGKSNTQLPGNVQGGGWGW